MICNRAFLLKKINFIGEILISQDKTLSQITHLKSSAKSDLKRKKLIQYNQNDKIISLQKSPKMPKQDENATFRKKMQQTVTFVPIFCHL